MKIMTTRQMERRLSTRRCVVLPSVVIKQSTIRNAGLGLFVEEHIPKGGYITEFGGVIIGNKQARSLMDLGQDTHLRTIDPMHTCFDSRVTVAHPIEWYLENHLLAGFANDPFGSSNLPNAKPIEIHVPNGYRTPTGDCTLKRIFLIATSDIPAGSEIFFNYGTQYHDRHFCNE